MRCQKCESKRAYPFDPAVLLRHAAVRFKPMAMYVASSSLNAIGLNMHFRSRPDTAVTCSIPVVVKYAARCSPRDLLEFFAKSLAANRIDRRHERNSTREMLAKVRVPTSVLRFRAMANAVIQSSS